MTEKEFKTELSKGIKEISESLSSDMEPINKDVLVKMTNKIYELIISLNLKTDIELYNQTFIKILTGEIVIYKLNVLSLIIAFKSQQRDEIGPGEYYTKEGVRMRFNKAIPRGTRPCPSTQHKWSESQNDWYYGN